MEVYIQVRINVGLRGVSGQLHSQPLTPGEQPSLPTEQTLRWAPDMTGGKSLKQLSSPEHEQTHICTRLVNHYRPSCSHRLLNGNWIAFLVLQNFPPSTQICVQSFANEYGLHNQALTPRKGRDFSPIIMLGMTLASVSPLHSEYRGNYLWKKAAGG